MRTRATLAGALVLGILLSGCAGQPEPVESITPTPSVSAVPTPTPTQTPLEVSTAVGKVATAEVASITAYDAPDGAEIESFSNPLDSVRPARLPR